MFWCVDWVRFAEAAQKCIVSNWLVKQPKNCVQYETEVLKKVQIFFGITQCKENGCQFAKSGESE